MDTERDLQQSIKTIARGAGITFTGIVLGNVLGTLNQVLLGRFLGVSDYGHFNLALSIINVAQVLSILGISGGVSRFIPFHMKKGEQDMVKSTIRFSLRFVFISSVTIGILLYLLAGPISVKIFHDQSFYPVLRVFMLGLPIVVLASVLIAVIRAFKAMAHRLMIYDIGMKVVRAAIFVPAIFLGYVFGGAIVAYFGAMLFTLAASWFVIRKKLFPKYSEYPNVPVAKKLLSFSWPLGLTGATSLAATRSDIILLGYFLTSKDIGIFTPAVVIAQMLSYISRSFELIFLPVVSEFFARENKAQLSLIFKSVSKWLFIILLLALLFIVVFPKETILLLYGKEYADGWRALLVLALGFSIGTAVSLSGNILVAAGHTKLSLASEIVGAVGSLSLNFILIPIYGIVGAAVAAGASFALRGLAALIFTYRTEKIHPFSRDFLKALLAGLISLGIIFGLKTYLTGSVPMLALMVGLGLLLFLIYGGLLLLSRVFDETDRFVLDAVEKKTGIKLRFLRRFI